VLAAGEIAKSSGTELIVAAVLAYEIQCRLCDAASLRKHGFDHVNLRRLLSSALGREQIVGVEYRTDDARFGDRGRLQHGPPANAQRRTQHVEGVRVRETPPATASSRPCSPPTNDRPAPIFEGDLGFMKLLTGPFAVAEWAATGGPS